MTELQAKAQAIAYSDNSPDEKEKYILELMAEQKRLILEAGNEMRKDYWHLQWDGTPDLEEAERRRKFNTEATGYINSVITDYQDRIKNT